MAATTTVPLTAPPHAHRQASPALLPWSALLPLLTVLTLLIDGYHPLAEDGGLYVAGIEYRLDPTLFPRDTAFVTAHLRYSLFAPAIATLTRLTYLPLAWILFAGYLFSLWFLLYAGLQLLRRCTSNPLAQLSGVALLAAWSTLPVAGTSLLLTDPYLTARSLTTPLSLLAIAFALDGWHWPQEPVDESCCFEGAGLQSRQYSQRKKWGFSPGGMSSSLVCLIAAALFHPLMAASALAMVIFLRLVRRPRPWLLCSSFMTFAVLAAAAINALAPPDPPALVAASLSRYYWFLSQWQWYELCGLLGPLCVIGLLLRSRALTENARRLSHAALAAAAAAIVIALLFAHADSPSHLIARLQPLRIFLLVYALMALLLGASFPTLLHTAAAGRRASALRAAIVPAVLLLSGIALFAAQRATFPASQHFELPWLVPANPWSQAFLWVRANTPRDALFALDTDYITTPGEDAQTFRATAQRSALPDFSKDGGEASITPSLATLWQQSLAAQSAVQSGTHLTTHNTLSTQTDAERELHLRPLGVTWLVLHADASTTRPCPYSNAVVKACRLLP